MIMYHSANLIKILKTLIIYSRSSLIASSLIALCLINVLIIFGYLIVRRVSSVQNCILKPVLINNPLEYIGLVGILSAVAPVPTPPISIK